MQIANYIKLSLFLICFSYCFKSFSKPVCDRSIEIKALLEKEYGRKCEDLTEDFLKKNGLKSLIIRNLNLSSLEEGDLVGLIVEEDIVIAENPNLTIIKSGALNNNPIWSNARSKTLQLVNNPKLKTISSFSMDFAGDQLIISGNNSLTDIQEKAFFNIEENIYGINSIPNIILSQNSSLKKLVKGSLGYIKGIARIEIKNNDSLEIIESGILEKSWAASTRGADFIVESNPRLKTIEPGFLTMDDDTGDYISVYIEANNGLKTLYGDTFIGARNIFIHNNNNLVRIEPKICQGCVIHKFHITGNSNLEELDDRIFEGITFSGWDRKGEGVAIVGNSRLKTLGSKLFNSSTTPPASILINENHSLEIIPPHLFSEISFQTEDPSPVRSSSIEISKNDSLRVLSEEAFKNLSNVSFIRISNNGKLDTIYKNTFSDVSFNQYRQQSQIQIKHNPLLKSLPENWHHGLKGLSRLDLSNHSLRLNSKNIPNKLDYFSAFYEQISSSDDLSFAGKSIESLRIRRPSIPFPSNFFGRIGIEKVSTLILFNEGIDSIPANAFLPERLGLKNEIETINLYNNSLTHVDLEAFSGVGEYIVGVKLQSPIPRLDIDSELDEEAYQFKKLTLKENYTLPGKGLKFSNDNLSFSYFKKGNSGNQLTKVVASRDQSGWSETNFSQFTTSVNINSYDNFSISKNQRQVRFENKDSKIYLVEDLKDGTLFEVDLDKYKVNAYSYFLSFFGDDYRLARREGTTSYACQSSQCSFFDDLINLQSGEVIEDISFKGKGNNYHFLDYKIGNHFYLKFIDLREGASDIQVKSLDGKLTCDVDTEFFQDFIGITENDIVYGVTKDGRFLQIDASSNCELVSEKPLHPKLINILSKYDDYSEISIVSFDFDLKEDFTFEVQQKIIKEKYLLSEHFQYVTQVFNLQKPKYMFEDIVEGVQGKGVVFELSGVYYTPDLKLRTELSCFGLCLEGARGRLKITDVSSKKVIKDYYYSSSDLYEDYVSIRRYPFNSYLDGIKLPNLLEVKID